MANMKNFFYAVLVASIAVLSTYLLFSTSFSDNINAINASTDLELYDQSEYGNYIQDDDYDIDWNKYSSISKYAELHATNVSKPKIIMNYRTCGAGNGLGSTLLQYYYLRSLSFWNKGNIQFQMDPNIDNMLYFNDNDKSLFSYYLPKISNVNILNNTKYITKYLQDINNINHVNINRTKYYELLNKIGNIMFQRIEHENKFALFSPPISPIFLFIYNGVFLPIIQDEINLSLIKYFGKSFIDNFKDEIDKNCNTIIHFRGGDILETPGNGYGIIASSYFENIINEIWIKENKKELNICIITQLPLNWRCANCSNSDNFLVNPDVPKIQQKDMNLYAMFMQQIEQRLRLKLSKFGELTIIGNSSLNLDFLRMVYAKYLICTTSTLCLFSAMSRSSTYYSNAYLPKKSVWKLYQPDIPVYNTEMLNFLYFNMTPIYKHNFIDNSNCTWFNPMVYQKIHDKTIQDVVEYFFNH